MRWFINTKKRSLPGKRWLSVSMRTLHLIGICGLAGAYLFQQPEQEWFHFLVLTVVSGLCMAAMEIYTNSIWLIQMRGLAIGIKLLLLSTMLWWFEQPNAAIYFLIIIISGIVSHAPGKLRYYSVWHGCVMTEEIIRQPEEIKNCGG